MTVEACVLKRGTPHPLDKGDWNVHITLAGAFWRLWLRY